MLYEKSTLTNKSNKNLSNNNYSRQIYCKQRKILWVKLLRFSWFSGVLRKFFREYKCLSLIVLNNEHLWPRQCESISVKTSMALKLQIFSLANLSPSTVLYYQYVLVKSYHE